MKLTADEEWEMQMLKEICANIIDDTSFDVNQLVQLVPEINGLLDRIAVLNAKRYISLKDIGLAERVTAMSKRRVGNKT